MIKVKSNFSYEYTDAHAQLLSMKKEITGGHGILDRDEQVMHLLTVNIWTHIEKSVDDSLH